MKMNNLDKSVLKLWYIRALIAALALILAFVSVIIVLITTEVSGNVILAVSLGAGIPLVLLLGFIFTRSF